MTSCQGGKGDGNDGEPDARQKTGIGKKKPKVVGFKNLWMVRIENIQFDPPKEVRGQS